MENPIPPESATLETRKTSIAARFFNVIASPSEVYEEIREAQPNFWNWLWPVIIYGLIGSIFTLAVFSQKNILHQIREMQSKAVQDAVAKKKLPPESVAQVEEFNDKFGATMMKIAGSFGILVSGFITPFAWGLILWLLAAYLLKVPIPYMQAVEAAGIAMPILLLAVIVSSLLTVAMGRLFSTASLALLINDFDPANKLHLALAAINLFYLWMAAVMGIALSILTGKSLVKSLVGVFGVWILIRVIFLSVGMGQMLL
ncbi:MAG: hypothetical protein JWM99_3455 [Verrucomicrobiales bacterium]|nr:hypothetical protein [Verrucomicrobiales bacterium]